MPEDKSKHYTEVFPIPLLEVFVVTDHEADLNSARHRIETPSIFHPMARSIWKTDRSRPVLECTLIVLSDKAIEIQGPLPYSIAPFSQDAIIRDKTHSYESRIQTNHPNDDPAEPACRIHTSKRKEFFPFLIAQGKSKKTPR
jgi:hypothetical protein